jgi:hypothetical protein
MLETDRSEVIAALLEVEDPPVCLFPYKIYLTLRSPRPLR